MGQAMNQSDVYLDLDGQEVSLFHLDAEERKLVARIQRRARTHPDWDDFDNWWTRAVPKFYEARGIERGTIPHSIPWHIAQDLSSRLGIAEGRVRPDDYQGELEQLIREKFASQRDFCEATGIAEDMLSHVLAGRKDLSLASLTAALVRIGYRLRIVPAGEPVKTRRRKRTG
jgi:hypothetical protein